MIRTGALTTLVASYLARARGSNEPDLSITRVKDLDHFIREVKAFQLDYGHIDTDDWDKEIDRLRKRFEELLGNASGYDFSLCYRTTQADLRVNPGKGSWHLQSEALSYEHSSLVIRTHSEDTLFLVYPLVTETIIPVAYPRLSIFDQMHMYAPNVLPYYGTALLVMR